MNRRTEHQVRAYLSDRIAVGQDKRTGEMHYVSLDDLRTTHTLFVSGSGFGKSFLLMNWASELIARQQAFTLLCPHGDVFHHSLHALRMAGVRRDRIVVIDPKHSSHSVGFNPLASDEKNATEIVGLNLDAIGQAWTADFDSTPLLERVLTGTLHLLVSANLTMADAPHILNVDNARLRAALLERVNDPWLRRDWEELEKLQRSDKLAAFQSSWNRVRRLLQTRAVQMMLGQVEDTLDIRSILDDRKYLLVNLSAIADPSAQRLVAALLIHRIFHTAKRRDQRKAPHHFVIIDECAEFLTADIARSLDQLRKFHTSLVLVAQHLQQLERKDPSVAASVLGNCKVLVVLGGLSRQDSETLSKQLFTGRPLGNTIKHRGYGTRFRPILDWVDVESESWTESEGHSSSSSTSRSTGMSEGHAEHLNDPQSVDPDAIIHTDSQSESTGEAVGRTSGRTHGTSVTRAPLVRHEEFQEVTQVQFRNLSEEWEYFIALVHGLPKREALIRAYSKPVLHVVTPDVIPAHDEKRVAQFSQQLIERCLHAKRVEEVQSEIARRHEDLQKLLGPTKKTKAKMPDITINADSDSFRE